MRVSKEQAAENRRRIVDIAGALFRARGFNGIGVADLMKEAGLTHGGFYGHFASKDDLAAEACAHALAVAAERWERTADAVPPVAPEEALARIAAFYLSPRHRDDAGTGCPIAALGVDAARQGGGARRAFTEGLRPFIDTLCRCVRGSPQAAQRKAALATLSGMVGAVILARAVDDTTLSDEILDAARVTFGGTTPD